MVSSRWQKRNLLIEVIGWIIIGLTSLGIYNLPGPFSNLSVEARFGLAVLFFVVGFMVLGRLSNDYPRMMVRVLRTEQEEAAELIHKAMKAKHIRFSRHPEEEAEVTRYRFSGLSLVLQLEPFLIEGLPFDSVMKENLATKLTLRELSSRNSVMAARIAAAIDEAVWG